jgi:hypothetical protein
MTIENRLRKLEVIVSARPVERVGPPVWLQVQALLADPAEVAAAMEWDAKYLGEGSPDRIDFAGMDEEARIAALEKSLAA